MAMITCTPRIAAPAIKVLRAVGKKIREVRGEITFHPECTDLRIQSFDPAKFPGVMYGSEVSDYLAQRLDESAPLMVCRFGTTELATLTSATRQFNFSNLLRLASGDVLVRDIGIHRGLVSSLSQLSGFFPLDEDKCRRFVELMLSDMADIDVLGVWCKQEKLFESMLSDVVKVRFRDIEPYLHKNPWTRALAGRRVVIVHPFAETIERQYREKRQLLFSNSQMLPDFELITIKAVQSIASSRTEFSDWFEALDSMKAQLEKIEFDIAIIGCGAYGMPLAAHVKRMGKKAVHLGGQTQLLFGIKGKRWETGHEEIHRLFNEFWVYPSEHDRPAGYKKVEGGAYW